LAGISIGRVILAGSDALLSIFFWNDYVNMETTSASGSSFEYLVETWIEEDANWKMQIGRCRLEDADWKMQRFSDGDSGLRMSTFNMFTYRRPEGKNTWPTCSCTYWE
jgi:hypothetical protein